MTRINSLVSGCILLLAASGCSAITKWPDINDSTAKNTGGSGGEDEAGGSATKGGAGNQGGSTNLGGKSAAGTATGGTANVAGAASSSGGGGNVAGTSSGSGGATNVAGTASSSGGATAQGGVSNVGGVTNVAGTAATQGGAGTATGGAVSSTAGGASGTGNVAGAGGAASTLAIATTTLPIGKTGVAYTATVTASGASTYTWSMVSGTLPSGVTLQTTTSASVTIAGTAREAGLFPLKLSVTDGTSTKTIDVSLAVTHKVAFLSDRITSGVKELFLTEVGTDTAGTPVRLNTPLASGGVTSFAWSPDGQKVAHLGTTGTGAMLYVASVSEANAGTSISANVTNYLWLAEGQILAYTTTAGELFLVDVSAPKPWPHYAGGPTSSGILTASMLVASPEGRKLAVAFTDAFPAPNPTTYSAHIVSWDTGTSPTRTSVGTLPGAPKGMTFSSDGSLLAIDSPSVGLNVYDLTLSGGSGALLTTQPAHSWNPLSKSLLAQQNQLTTGLQFASYSSSWSTTTVLLNPNCTAVPGPWSPDGNHAPYTCGSDVRVFRNLSAASSGTDVSILPAGFLANPFTNVPAYGWSYDSQWIAFLADKDTSNLFDVYLVRWASLGTATKPYSSSAAPGVSAWAFAPNSLSVAFVGSLGTSTTSELYLSPLPTTGTPSSSAALTTTADPAVQNDIAWLPGSRVVLYRANDTGGAQLHAVHLSATGAGSSPISVSGSSGTGVPSYQPAPLP